MKILFIVSGNKGDVSIIVKNQANSLIEIGHDVKIYQIKQKGVLGYFKSIKEIKNIVKLNKHNVYHAHYSFSGLAAGLAGARPLAVSLMGSDVLRNYIRKIIVYIGYFLLWDLVIVKSLSLAKSLKIKKIQVLPNGVNFDFFKPFNSQTAKEKLGWNNEYKHILFAANPDRKEKNYILAKKAFDKLNIPKKILHTLKNIEHSKMPLYYNASDVIMLTSIYEGSPNVIKEALACNKPIIATDVGDVKENIKNIDGCFIAYNDVMDIKNKLEKALKFNGVVNSRYKISHLDSTNIARKLETLYYSLLK